MVFPCVLINTCATLLQKFNRYVFALLIGNILMFLHCDTNVIGMTLCCYIHVYVTIMLLCCYMYQML